MCFWMYYERIIFAEENFLRNKYGQIYIEWSTKTPIFIPRLIGWKQPNLVFSIKNVLKREYNGFFALFFTFALFDLSENLIRYKKWCLDEFWAYSLCISGIFSISLICFEGFFLDLYLSNLYLFNVAPKPISVKFSSLEISLATIILTFLFLDFEEI